MKEITSHGFDENVRSSLRGGHDFDHEQLNRVRNMYDHALVGLKQKTLDAKHFDAALAHMEEHPDWKHLSESKREAVKSVFRQHLGIAEEEAA